MMYIEAQAKPYREALTRLRQSPGTDRDTSHGTVIQTVQLTANQHVLGVEVITRDLSTKKKKMTTPHSVSLNVMRQAVTFTWKRCTEQHSSLPVKLMETQACSMDTRLEYASNRFGSKQSAKRLTPVFDIQYHSIKFKFNSRESDTMLQKLMQSLRQK